MLRYDQEDFGHCWNVATDEDCVDCCHGCFLIREKKRWEDRFFDEWIEEEAAREDEAERFMFNVCEEDFGPEFDMSFKEDFYLDRMD